VSQVGWGLNVIKTQLEELLLEFVHAQILHEAQSTYQNKDNGKPWAVPACFLTVGAIQYNNKEATYATFQVGSPDPIKPGTKSTYCVPPERVFQRQDVTGHCPVCVHNTWHQFLSSL